MFLGLQLLRQNAELYQRIRLSVWRKCFSFFQEKKSPKKKDDDKRWRDQLRCYDQDSSQFGPSQKNKTILMHIYSSLIRRGMHQCQTALFSFSCCATFWIERAFVLYYCHQSKYRSFLLDFCMHLSNEARRRRELKAYKNSRLLKKPCVFYALFFFNLNGTTRKFNLQHFPPLLHQNVYQCFKG